MIRLPDHNVPTAYIARLGRARNTEYEWLSFDAIIHNKSVLQTDILINNMNLEKIIEILVLIYIIY